MFGTGKVMKYWWTTFVWLSITIRLKMVSCSLGDILFKIESACLSNVTGVLILDFVKI
jgi:hypothetical protein